MKDNNKGPVPTKTKPYEEYTSKISGRNSQSAVSDCSELSFSTRLQNVTSAIASVKTKDSLSLKPGNMGEIKVYNNDAKLCGYIIDAKARRLLECMNKGNTYIAIVVKIVDEVCDVEVEKF